MKAAEKMIRVMLVDDHKTILWGLEKLIEGGRVRMEVVGIALTCEDALELVGRLVPDVLLLDLDMAGKSSLDILPALLANGVTRALVLSGTRDQAALDMAFVRGARGVLSKTVAPELVLKAIEKVHQGELWLDHKMLGRIVGTLMHPQPAARRNPEAEKIATLTAREREVIDAVIEGRGALNKELARSLSISERTLRNHLSSVYQKLEVVNRLELYIYAVKHRVGSTIW